MGAAGYRCTRAHAAGGGRNSTQENDYGREFQGSPRDAHGQFVVGQFSCAPKEELAAAKEKSQQRRDRLQAQEEERGGADGGRGDGGRGDGGRGDGGRESGKGGRGKGGSSSGFRDRDREEGWGDSGGGRCPAAPKERGGKGKGKRDRSAMQCLNCKQFGHKSRDCPEPVDEEAVRQRLAAKAAGKPIVPRRDQAASYSDQDD
mmetsp:Transcript_32581/g.75699  ORF Transcript_32581/g.75699 Transcript_32581/m.75699 type:complete len:203 (-) Transcript_32581:93-701(-)